MAFIFMEVGYGGCISAYRFTFDYLSALLSYHSTPRLFQSVTFISVKAHTLRMQRVKIINEPAELVPMFRCVDTPLKREVFKEVCMAWKTEDEIREKYGDDGVLALKFFEKMKLVEIRWQQKEDSIEPINAYHSFYSSFHINASWPIFEISDVLYAAIMPEKEYKKLEDKI